MFKILTKLKVLIIMSDETNKWMTCAERQELWEKEHMKNHRCKGSLKAQASIHYSPTDWEVGEWILSVLTIDDEWGGVKMERTGEIIYCPYCGKKLEVAENDK